MNSRGKFLSGAFVFIINTHKPKTQKETNIKVMRKRKSLSRRGDKHDSFVLICNEWIVY